MLYKRLFCLLCASLGFVSCRPDKDYYQIVDYNLVGNVLSDNSDNFNLNLFSTLLNQSGMSTTLRETGPFTVLAPSNNAFYLYGGYADVTGILAMPQQTISDLVNYHVIDGLYELNKLPFLFNQEIRSRSGKLLYVTRWVDVNSKDTVLTVNGATVQSRNIPASNGIINVIDQVVIPNVHDNLADAVAGNNALTLFNHAVYRAGLSDMLREKGHYTLFAPSSTAMAAYGFSSIQDVDKADPTVLAQLVRYHLMDDRKFMNDYVLTIPQKQGTMLAYVNFFGDYFWETVSGVVGEQYARMSDGNTVTVVIGVWSDMWFGTGTVFDLVDITGNRVHVVRGDITTGNGVLHIIDGVMRSTY